MNCLRIRPGTSRKPAAIVRKCAAQAAKSMLGASRYWTIAVIMISGSCATDAAAASSHHRLALPSRADPPPVEADPLLHREAGVGVARLKRGEAALQRRHRHLGDGLRGP